MFSPPRGPPVALELDDEEKRESQKAQVAQCGENSPWRQADTPRSTSWRHGVRESKRRRFLSLNGRLALSGSVTAGAASDGFSLAKGISLSQAC